MTIVLALFGYITIIEFPDRATLPSPITRRPFLTPPEATLILTRIQHDHGDTVPEALT
jgi:hypothetical protein